MGDGCRRVVSEKSHAFLGEADNLGEHGISHAARPIVGLVVGASCMNPAGIAEADQPLETVRGYPIAQTGVSCATDLHRFDG